MADLNIVDFIEDADSGAKIIGNGPATITAHGAQLSAKEIAGSHPAVVPQIGRPISECVLGITTDYCMDKNSANAIGRKIGSTAAEPSEIIEDAKKKTGCNTEKCAAQKLGIFDPTLYKPEGPTDTKLISNFDIDAAFAVFTRQFPEFFGYNFNMLNYADFSYKKGRLQESPDTLATITMEELYARGVRCAGCIINSDVYQGRGKHWMALFVDFRDLAAPTIEFFNSSGRSPVIEWCNWMCKTAAQLQQLIAKVGSDISAPTRYNKGTQATSAANDAVKIIVASKNRHQQSRTECGMYSLYYIYARLCGIPSSAFLQPISDKFMLEFRSHLFYPEVDSIGKPFNWQEYQKKVKVEWANSVGETGDR